MYVTPDHSASVNSTAAHAAPAGPAKHRPELEVADVIHAYGRHFLARYGPSLSLAQRRAFVALGRCRTAALGGHVEQCDACGARVISYNSCRNRHCPKCLNGRAAAWLEREAKSLLPVPYFHVVFTLPHELGPLALQNPALIYGLLFQAAAQTLAQIAADPKHLGAEIGVVAVLHTWGQTLQHHPHAHCIVSGGGLAVTAAGRREQPARWVSCRRGFFLPEKVLSAVYRGKFLALVRAAADAGRLRFFGKLAALAEPAALGIFLQPLYDKPWVVDCGAGAFAGPEVVLKYLARYTHRVAISNSRLVAMTPAPGGADGGSEGTVTFRYKDYAQGGQERHLTLSAVEFLRRFLMHVLPKGFVKVRHYGLVANGQREKKLTLCRQLLASAAAEEPAVVEPAVVEPAAKETAPLCPQCGQGHLHRVEDIPRPWRRQGAERVAGSGRCDSS